MTRHSTGSASGVPPLPCHDRCVHIGKRTLHHAHCQNRQSRPARLPRQSTAEPAVKRLSKDEAAEVLLSVVSPPLAPAVPTNQAQVAVDALSLLASLSPDMGPCVPSTNPPTFNLYKSHASESEDNESGEESEASSSSDYSKLLENMQMQSNTAGRIGIYNPAQRRALLARFAEKRRRRVWRKKVRYTCRKHLADNRIRVKGRFVKRDPATATAPAQAVAAS